MAGDRFLPLNVGPLCACAGMTRQIYYKQRRLRQRVAVDESLVLELIRRERSRQPMSRQNDIVYP